MWDLQDALEEHKGVGTVIFAAMSTAIDRPMPQPRRWPRDPVLQQSISKWRIVPSLVGSRCLLGDRSLGRC